MGAVVIDAAWKDYQLSQYWMANEMAGVARCWRLDDWRDYYALADDLFDLYDHD